MLASFITIVVKKLVVICFMVLVFATMLNFTTNSHKIEQENRKLNTIAHYIENINGGLRVDSARVAAIQKINNIMIRYNRDLYASEAYAIANEIYSMSVKYDNLDVDLICATITHESARTWRANVVSPAGAIGLMQIMPYTGYFLSKHEGIEWTKPEEVLTNPISNIRMGCRYLSMLIELYHVDGGLAAYNGGEKRAARWLASGRNDDVLFEETRGYVPAVLKLYDSYRN